MKETLLQMARYHIWANKKIAGVLRQLDDGTLDRVFVSSFPSIRRTAYHMWSAEFIWLQRLRLVENPVWVEADFTGTAEAAWTNWEQVSLQLAEFIERQPHDRALEHVIQYYTRNKEAFKTPVSGVLQHVFNHATYHRGQLVTLFRQAGVTRIPPTDMVVYLRKGGR